MAKKDMPKVEVSAGPVAPDRDEERRWKAEDALRTMTRAEEHRADPDLMKEVAKVRDSKMKELARVKLECTPTSKKAK